MKILKNEKTPMIILEDEDIIIVKTLKKNPIELHIQCESGTLLIDEVNVKEIHNLKEERQQATIMKSYLKNK